MKNSKVTVKELKALGLWEDVCDMLGYIDDADRIKNDFKIAFSDGQLRQIERVKGVVNA